MREREREEGSLSCHNHVSKNVFAQRNIHINMVGSHGQAGHTDLHVLAQAVDGEGKKERTKPHVEGIGTDAIQHYPTLIDTNLH